ncbi:MAG: acetyl-CoA carboxylase biotin carboxyl carrier protein subunit [Bdellovibrionaceae bacterium]|nr:acetyl-CoA carboxylase biotin carboxyl carrier protein subunit [Pseudobdellovibrionaceae bacterium]MDW8190547.1 acetyl-CoA carboxylase biotin carboxyl carrier protein subunit [Pseudobdellovibrionaceae bacterium]
MYFEAELNGKKYKVDVIEQRHSWKIAIAEAGKDWTRYEISKEDFKRSESYFTLLFKGASYLVDVIGKDTEYTVFTRNSARTVKIYNDEMLLHESLKRDGNLGQQKDIKAGMPGKIIQIFVKPGEIVKANRPLLIMEAMKMENEIRSTNEAKVKNILVKQGDSVETGQTLITFE